jgi:hypothetical protein
LNALPRDCTPAYEPTFDAIFDNRLVQTCGSAATGRTCHGPTGRQGDLYLSERAAAYDALLGVDGSHARVVPFDPECSDLMRRLTADDPAVQMPPGRDQRLSDAEICSVLTWIADGAEP